MPEEIGMAKSIEEVLEKEASQKIEHTDARLAGTPLSWEEVPINVWRYFNIDIGTADKDTIDKIKTIYEWAKDNDIANTLRKISVLENRLGSPHLAEKRFDKIYNWVKLTLAIKKLEAERASYE